MTTIVTVRHGETTWNREGRLQGWAPVPLTGYCSITEFEFDHETDAVRVVRENDTGHC
ncbi:histidine phosphatase family protein [Halosimplex rubrum]|uniref:histidine phosphatase family protein n=1 Tax=Halosimplex rubrum TaxID=869889 RepID=UPI0037435D5D